MMGVLVVVLICGGFGMGCFCGGQFFWGFFEWGVFNCGFGLMAGVVPEQESQVEEGWNGKKMERKRNEMNTL